MMQTTLVSFWDYVTRSTAAHRYAGFFVALYCVLRSLVVAPSDASMGYAGGFHAFYVGLYVVIAGSYDIPTTIEIMCLQTITLCGFIIENVVFWHYVFFPLVMIVFLLLEIRIPNGDAAVLWYMT